MAMQEPCTIDCQFADTFYYNSINEDGWKCVGCQHEFGFNPFLDRERCYIKVDGILRDLHDAKLVYVSNGTMGMVVCEQVTARCERENRYDQDSILQFILENPNMKSDGKFWQEEAVKWMAEHKDEMGDEERTDFEERTALQAMQSAAELGQTRRLVE